MRKDKGQSLIEITVSIGVAVVIITAITTVTIVGLRNSQYSQNSAQASKLAQDTIEKIRAIRDSNGTVCYTPPSHFPTFDTSNYEWNDPTNGFWAISCPTTSGSECWFKIVSDGSSCPNTGIPSGYITNNPYLKTVSGSTTDQISGTIFTRSIIVSDFPNAINPTVKKFTVRVSWSDYSGSHKSELVTILTQN